MPSASPNEPLVAKILTYYHLQPQVIWPPQKGYRNTSYPADLSSGQRSNLILYKIEPGILAKIKGAHAVSDFLVAQNMPVRHTIDPRIVQLKTGERTKYAALYNYLPGETIPWEAYTKAHLKLLGCTMSDMHAALRPAGKLVKHTVTNEYKTILGRMKRYFRDARVADAMRQKLQLRIDLSTLKQQGKLLEKCENLPIQQTLHMDFVRGNILFTEVSGQLRISGILDFEKTVHGHPLFDIARTLAFLLVDCKYMPASKIRKYFLYSGYQKRGHTKFNNPRVKTVGSTTTLLEELINLFLIHDFYKFLRHNPYELLYQNEHYVRTAQLLLEREILSRI